MNALYDGFWRLIINFAFVGPTGDRLRGFCWQKLGVKAGDNFKVGTGVVIHSPKKVLAGNNVYIGVMSYIGAGTITIGDEVLIGNHVQITASDHTQDSNGSFRFGLSLDKGVTIQNAVWLCGGCRILGGASVGAQSLVGPNVIVRGIVPPKSRLVINTNLENTK